MKAIINGKIVTANSVFELQEIAYRNSNEHWIYASKTLVNGEQVDRPGWVCANMPGICSPESCEHTNHDAPRILAAG